MPPPDSRRALSAVMILAACTLAGCSHYKVTDPNSGKAYYTTDVDRERSGTVSFKSAADGSRVTLTSSEVKKISKKEYKAGLKSE